MPKFTEQSLLLKYIDGELTPLSKPLKNKEQAEKARLRYPEKERKTIGVGAIGSRDTTEILQPDGVPLPREHRVRKEVPCVERQERNQSDR